MAGADWWKKFKREKGLSSDGDSGTQQKDAASRSASSSTTGSSKRTNKSNAYSDLAKKKNWWETYKKQNNLDQILAAEDNYRKVHRETKRQLEENQRNDAIVDRAYDITTPRWFKDQQQGHAVERSMERYERDLPLYQQRIEAAAFRSDLYQRRLQEAQAAESAAKDQFQRYQQASQKAEADRNEKTLVNRPAQWQAENLSPQEIQRRLAYYRSEAATPTVTDRDRNDPRYAYLYPDAAIQKDPHGARFDERLVEDAGQEAVDAAYRPILSEQEQAAVKQADQQILADKAQSNYEQVQILTAAQKLQGESYSRARGQQLIDEIAKGGEAANRAKTGKAMFEQQQARIAADTDVEIKDDLESSRGAYTASQKERQRRGYILGYDWDNVPEEQKQAVYALFTRSPQQAIELAKYYIADARQAEDERRQAWYAQNALTAGVGLVASAGAHLAAAVDPFGEVGQELTRRGDNALTGGARWADTAAGYQKIPEWVPIVGGKGAGDLYQTAGSVVQSIAIAAPAILAGRYDEAAAEVVSKLGLVLMGSSAAASDYRESVAAGMDDDRAKLHALAAGVEEALFEEVSLDKIVSMDTSGGFKALVRNWLVQSGVEGSEELATDIANRVTDELISGAGQSKVERRTSELIANGMSATQAKQQAENEWLTDTLYDGFQGFLSGGIMTGGNYALQGVANLADRAANTVETRKAQRQAGAAISSTEGSVEALQAYAKDKGIEIKAVKTTEQNAEQNAGESTEQNAGESTEQNAVETTEQTNQDGKQNSYSSRDYRSISDTTSKVMQSIRSEVRGKTVQEQQTIRDSLVEKYGEGIAPVVNNAISVETAARVRQEYGSVDSIQAARNQAVSEIKDESLRRAVSDGYDSAAYSLAASQGGEGGMDTMSRYIQQRRNTGSGSEMSMNATVTAQDGSTKTIAITGMSEDGKHVSLADGSEVAVKDLQADEDTTSAIQQLADLDLGDDATKVLQAYQQSGVSGTDGYRWLMDYATAYNQGRTRQISLEQAAKRSSLDERTVMDAYTLGQQAANRETQAGLEKLKNLPKRKGASGRTANIDTTEIRGKTMSKSELEQFELANQYAQALGVDIVWFSSREKDGKFIDKNGAYENGKIYMDIHAGRNFTADLTSGILATIGHELTHFQQQYAPEEYRALKEFVLQQIVKSAANGEARLERLIWEKRRRSGNTLSRKAAEDEVVADACQKMLRDSKAVHDFANQQPEAANGVVRWLDKWFKRVRSIFGRGGNYSEEAQIMDSLEQDVKAAFGELWDKALKQAVQVHDEVGNIEKPATEGESKEESKAQNSDRDTEYLELAKDPEKNAARLQEMVDYAAWKAGYTNKAYHGTAAEFTAFSKEKIGSTFFKDKDGFFFTTDQNGAKYYASASTWAVRNGKAKVMDVVLKTKNPLIVESRIVSPVKYFDTHTEALIQKAKKGKRGVPYDSIIVTNDATSKYKFGDPDTERLYVVFEPEQIKSADPVTYDDAGNVIPLSERFNEANEDIRYSERDNAKPRSAQAQRDAGYKLSESKFYSLYSAHKLNMIGKGNVQEQISSIMADGFKGDGGFGNNVMPTNISYDVDENGKRIPRGLSAQKYAPKKGEYILLVPKEGVEVKGGRYNFTERVKPGYKPAFDYEIVQADYDGQPYYEMYERAYDKSQAGKANVTLDGAQFSDRPNTDSAGRELSEGQQEYFKDSKVRDGEGHLIPVYHGTKADFHVFDFTQGGVNGTQEGFGIYLTNDKRVSDSYGDRVIEGYANIKRPATSWQKTIKRGELVKLIKTTCMQEAQRMVNDGEYDSVQEALFDTWISNYVLTYESASMEPNYRKAADVILQANSNDMDIIQEVIIGQGIRSYPAAMEFYHNALIPATGIDGFWTKWKSRGQGVDADVILAFDSNQVKNVDNLNPTKNPDIRYSERDISEIQDEYEEALADGNPDWQQQLVAEAAYNAGYRTGAYHGSPQTDITEFSTRSENTKKEKLQLLFGTHFTQDRRYAEIYAKKARNSKGTSRMTTKTGRVYDVWLDLGKSLDLQTAKNYTPGTEMYQLYDDLPDRVKKRVPALKFTEREIEMGLGTGTYVNTVTIEKALQAMTPKEATDFLVGHGYNSVLYLADYSTGMANNRGTRDPSIIMLDPERIKSADPITRSQDGNIIPLTERFNPAKKDIRYSERDYSTPSDEELLMQAKAENATSKNMRQLLTEYQARGREVEKMEAKLSSLKEERDAWREKSKHGGKYAQGLIDSKNRDIAKLEKQIHKYRDIMAGKANSPELNKLLKAEREKAEARVKEQKEAQFANYKDRKRQTEIRNRIKNLHAEMQRDLLKPREGHFVPESLIRPVVELLDMVNTQTNRAKSESAQAKIDAINAQYDKLKNDERYSMYYDETVKAMLVDLSDTLGGRSIYEMNSAELEDVYTAMKAMRTTVRNAIKADLIEKGKQIWEVGNELRQELRNGKGASRYLLEKYHMAMLSAERAFHRFGGYRQGSTWDKAYRMLDDAQLKMLNLEMQATRIFDPVLKAKADFAQAEKLTSIKEKDLVDVGLKDADGNAVKITRGMMLSLYMHLQNEENMRHLMYGGMTLPDYKKYYNGNSEAWGRGTVEIPALGAKVANLDALLEELGEQGVDEKYAEYKAEIEEMFESVRQNIEDKLTDYDRKWIAASKQFFDGFSRRELNKVTNEMYGFSKAKVDNYFPIVTDSNFLKSEFDSISRNISLENAGFMKERVKASNPILLEDITRTVNRQISNVSRYAGLTQALKQFGNIYNVQTKGFTDSVKKAMAKSYGKNGQEYIQNLITDMIGGRSQPGSIFDRIKGNYAQAVLSANLSVTIKQAASFPTAAATVGWKPILKALVKGGRNNRIISRADRTLIDTYSPLLWKRSQGAIDTEIGDMAHAQDWTKKAKWLMGWIEKTDIATVGRLWSAAEYYVQGNFKGLQKGTEEQIRNGESEYYRKVADVFNAIVEDTQPNYTVLQRPDILRNPSKLVRAMTMFSTQRFQNANILIDAVNEYAAMVRYDKRSGTAETKAARKAAKTKLTNAISSQVVSAVVLNVMTLVAGAIMHRMNPWRDDDDELTTESIMEEMLNGFASSMAGSFLGGSELYEAVHSLLTESRYYGNDVGGISTINEFATAVVQFGQQGVKLIGDENSTPEDWKKLAEKQLAKVGQYLAQMTGIPAANINKIIAGGKNHVIDAVNGEFFSFEAGVERSSATNAIRYMKAIQAGDTEKAEAVMKEMRDNYKEEKPGLSEKAIDRKVRGALASYIKEQYTSKQISEDEAISYLVDYAGKEENDAFWQIREWEAKKAHKGEAEYTFSPYEHLRELIDNGKDPTSEIAYLQEHGKTASAINSDVKKYIKKQFGDGELSEQEAMDLLQKYHKVKDDRTGKYRNDTEDEAWFILDEWKEGIENEDDEEFSYVKYRKLFSAMDNDDDASTAWEEMSEHGVSDDTLKKAVSAHLQEQFQAGEISEDVAIDRLQNYRGMDEDEAYWQVDKWKSSDAAYEAGDDFNESNYRDLYAAIDGNKDPTAAMKELTSHGYKERDVYNAAEEYLVKRFEDGKINESQLKNQLSRYAKVTKNDDVSEIVTKARCYKETGYRLGNLNTEYLDGEIGADKFKQIQTKYGGMSTEDAKKRVRWLDAKKASPNLEVTEAQCNNWYDGSSKSRENGHESAKAAGMSIEDYIKAKTILEDVKDANGNRTGEDEYIAALTKITWLTPRQKDALYYEKYKGTTKYSYKTW